MFCEHCGTQIDPNSEFCSHCGAKLATRLAEVPSHRANKPTKKLQTILILSIPGALIAVVVVWFLSGVVGSQREGFEKFLPENTAYYVELYDPIGLAGSFARSELYKRLIASPQWKEGGIKNFHLRTFEDVIARLGAVRNVVGPVGIASIPSFSETGIMVFVRIGRDYIGASRVGLEQFLDSQNVKYRKSQRAGKIKYDIDGPLNYSFVLMDKGIVAAETPVMLDKYIDWLETNGTRNLGNSENFRKIDSRKSGANARARIYFESSTFLNSLTKPAGPSVFTGLTNVPAWVAKTDFSFNDG